MCETRTSYKSKVFSSRHSSQLCSTRSSCLIPHRNKQEWFRNISLSGLSTYCRDEFNIPTPMSMFREVRRTKFSPTTWGFWPPVESAQSNFSPKYVPTDAVNLARTSLFSTQGQVPNLQSIASPIDDTCSSVIIRTIYRTRRQYVHEVGKFPGDCPLMTHPPFRSEIGVLKTRQNVKMYVIDGRIFYSHLRIQFA